jgi:superfamily II DNA or RNA helicase
MAYAISKANITDEQAATIMSMLTIHPQRATNKYQKDKQPEPIVFYMVKNGIVHVPFLFAASLFQITPNINIEYQKTTIQFNGSLRENQIPVELEAWQQLEKFGATTLALATGFGKTILGASLTVRTKLLTCILVHREILTVQWKQTFEEFTNANVWIVGEKCPPLICDVIICMGTRVHHLPDCIKDMIGTLIIDEAHTFCTTGNVQGLLSFHPKYIIVETATLERDDELHSMVYAMAGSHGIFIESNRPFLVMKIKTNTKPERKFNYKGGVSWHDLVRDTLFDERRNQIIIDLVKNNLDKNILILTSLVEHVELLNKMIKQAGITSDFMCGTKNSYTEGQVLVGSLSKLGCGFDQKTSCQNFSGKRFNLLILCISIKSYILLVQSIGRIFRSEFPTVMHLVDEDDIYKTHWYKARKWYLARGASITEHNMENKDAPRPTNQDVSQQQAQWIKKKAQQLSHQKLMQESQPKPVRLSLLHVKK